MLVNTLYRILQSNYGFLYLMIMIAIGNLSLVFIENLYGISLFLFMMIGVITLVIMKSNGRIRFNKSLYYIPKVGEKIMITKQFYCDDHLVWKAIPNGDEWPGAYTHMNVGDEWEITDVVHVDDDFIFRVKDKVNDTARFRYFDSRKFWSTKAIIRDEKLKKLGIK